MTDIFISYAKNDREKVEPIAIALKEQGWSVFWDRAIPGGKTWDEVIEEGLDAAKCVVVVWSSTSVNSDWVHEEAEEAQERHILVPAMIDKVKPPLSFRRMQAARLMNWIGDSNHPEFLKLQNGIEVILSPAPLKIKDAEEKRLEEERKRKQEEERKAAEEKLHKEQELKRKVEEECLKMETEAKQKAEEEQKRKESKAKIKPDEAEPAKIKPAKPKPDLRARNEPKPPKRRKTGSTLKFVAVAGVIVLLMFGVWRYFSGSQTKKQLIAEQTDKSKPPVEKPKINAPEPSSPRKVITNSIDLEFVLIPAGSFTMGSQLSPEEMAKRYGGEAEWFKDEQPPHPVEITKPFYLQTTEVTQGQWKRVMDNNNPSKFKDCGDDCPVEQVSWDDAQKFIEKLNKKEGINKYRLPTEAEWEYACRAKTTTPFSTGECISTDQANYNGYKPGQNCYKGEYLRKTVKVGSFRPNDWGLYNMHGNVWEWCQDWYGNYPSNSVVDPKGPDKGRGRVLRGGSWFNYAWYLRSANRYRCNPDNRFNHNGFRVARDF